MHFAVRVVEREPWHDFFRAVPFSRSLGRLVRGQDAVLVVR